MATQKSICSKPSTTAFTTEGAGRRLVRTRSPQKWPRAQCPNFFPLTSKFNPANDENNGYGQHSFQCLVHPFRCVNQRSSLFVHRISPLDKGHEIRVDAETRIAGQQRPVTNTQSKIWCAKQTYKAIMPPAINIRAPLSSELSQKVARNRANVKMVNTAMPINAPLCATSTSQKNLKSAWDAPSLWL